MRTVYEFSVKDRKGKDVALKEYSDEVLLIVNTATKCGFTPQYEELEKVYEKYHSQGFEILDFPCNQFGSQAPGTDESIHSFCKLTYGTEFPRFKKVKVNGPDADALFKFLKEEKGFAGWDESHPIYPILDKMLSEADPNYKDSPDIKWNFTKFLTNKRGQVVARLPLAITTIMPSSATFCAIWHFVNIPPRPKEERPVCTYEAKSVFPRSTTGITCEAESAGFPS